MTERGLAARGIDTNTPNVARIYDYLLGGKDNISQVVWEVPHSDPTMDIQARQARFSKTTSLAVRGLSGAYMGINVRFVGRGVLTLA